MTTATIAGRRLGRALTDTDVITRRNLLANVRLPDVLILSTVQPVVFMLMFLYVFGGAIQAALPAAAKGEYVYWLIPGILAQSAVFGSAPTAYGLNNDTATGVLDRFRSLPMARSAVLAGRTLSDLVRSTFILGLQLAVGVLLGFRWQNGLASLLAAIAVALAFGYACSWLMAYIGLTIRNSEAIQAAIYIVVFPMTLISSVLLECSRSCRHPAKRPAAALARICVRIRSACRNLLSNDVDGGCSTTRCIQTQRCVGAQGSATGEDE